jgi:hypothetical protein
MGFKTWKYGNNMSRPAYFLNWREQNDFANYPLLAALVLTRVSNRISSPTYILLIYNLVLWSQTTGGRPSSQCFINTTLNITDTFSETEELFLGMEPSINQSFHLCTAMLEDHLYLMEQVKVLSLSQMVTSKLLQIILITIITNYLRF